MVSGALSRVVRMAAVATLCAALPAGARAQAESGTSTGTEQTAPAEKKEGGGVGRAILLWPVNRVFDVLDMVRLRARLGPGLAVQARVTEAGAMFFGGYTSAFVGLPGPRGKPEIPLPLGVESLSGVQVSVAKETTDKEDERGEGMGPHYGPLEVGAGTQLLILGFDVGVAPEEILDFVTGIVFVDITKDDF